MIFIGYSEQEKLAEIGAYMTKHGLTKLKIFHANQFPLTLEDYESVKYTDIIMYVYYYRLLQEIGDDTLIVISECLRTQNRYDLTYNCLRNMLNQTNHQLIFNQLPQIDTQEDFMILFDFDTRSRWKRRAFDQFLIQRESQVVVRPLEVCFERVDVPTLEKTRQKYVQERDKMFRELGKRDPNIIPRNLYLMGGMDKLAHINVNAPLFSVCEKTHVARNNRLKTDCIVTYDEVEYGRDYGIVELPHRFIDFCDFLQVTWQTRYEVLCTDLKVDYWYFDRYQKWSERVNETCSSLSA